MKRKLATLLFTAALALSSHAAMVTVNWLDFNNPLLGSDNFTPLTAGSAANGDGCILELGYYTLATTSNNFSGEWVALTGPNSANTAFSVTTIGDMDGGAESVGLFGLQTSFDTLDSTKNQNLPTVGTPLTIRFYNATSIGAATFFGAVSNDAWVWPTPKDLSEAPVLNMSVDSTTAGLEWQGGGSGFYTNNSMVPEPSTAVLGLAAAAGFALRRRRA